MTVPSDEFTLYESTPIDESSIELARMDNNPTAGTDNHSNAANTSESSSEFDTITAPIPPPMVRRHRFPHFFPILTLCRYFAIVYATSFVTTEFATPSIRHTAVRDNNL